MSQFIEMFKGDNQVPLGDICNIEKGATITRNDVLPGEVPVVAGGQEPSCYHNVANREAGAITVSASGAYAGYINFWNCPIFASDCNTIISKDDEKTDQTFVYFGLRAMQKQIYGLQKGGAQPHVYGKDLQKFMFPCPSYAKQIEFSKMAKQADKSEFVGCKSQFIEMYYNTHNKQTLESVCPIMNKGITPKYVESSSVLVINQACIHWDGQRLGNIKYHNEEIPVRKRILESGDVLLNATGNGTLGRCCVFICPSDNNTYINDGHVIALSTDRAVILPEVLNTYLSLNDTQAEIYRQYVTGSTNQVDIVFSDIKKMKVPVPSMDEQILFVEVLTQADKSEYYN